MDIEKIGETYTNFRNTAEEAFKLLDGLIGHMQNAADNGDSQAGEWVEQLKKIASTFQDGQGSADSLLQQFHGVLSLLGQKNEAENKEGGENSGTANMISSLLNSDLGKSLESGAMQNIGSTLLGKLFK
ncbi:MULTISPECIES: hypothetical protein [unclassified Saccharibacter]|uniref:hypothetical protein n=1 Tax=unclassified Saccharibacter TaxID=2648722 RepID=UPI001322080B|nr:MULTISPECIES: hypothetical protein [unclassified Saccharibacter]MXV36176.1 hypothetical protein [Saccharibacter sp. EH611]MXV57035.1 hypothetical protein [Saccharibacter sp. EH70]MXV66605.1 hypothetical protein [Saccharibacter sp. EH60]